MDLALPTKVTLTDRELEVIRRIQAGAFPHPEFQAYPDYVDYHSHETEVMPMDGADEPKRRFIPSKVSPHSTTELGESVAHTRVATKRGDGGRGTVVETQSPSPTGESLTDQGR